VRPATMDGLWFLSPARGKVTVDSIAFIGATPEDQQLAAVSGCQPTYQRSAPDLTPIADFTETVTLVADRRGPLLSAGRSPTRRWRPARRRSSPRSGS
jgi:hypothetical protein